MTGRPDLLAVAFELIAERGWAAFSLGELARRAGVTLAEAYAELPGRSALLDRLAERADAAMLGLDAAELAEMTPRERLFEAIMRRLEALAPMRAGLAAIARGRDSRPLLLCCALPRLRRMTGQLVELAGAGPGPARSAIAASLLMLLYARVFQVWLADETADLAATMAELDRRLGQLALLLGGLDGAGPRPAAAAA